MMKTTSGVDDVLGVSIPQPNWVMVHMKTIYFQNPISIPDYHAHFQNYRAKIEDQNVVSGVYSEFLFECNN